MRPAYNSSPFLLSFLLSPHSSFFLFLSILTSENKKKGEQKERKNRGKRIQKKSPTLQTFKAFLDCNEGMYPGWRNHNQYEEIHNAQGATGK
jgi:hypothetical protein